MRVNAATINQRCRNVALKIYENSPGQASDFAEWTAESALAVTRTDGKFVFVHRSVKVWPPEDAIWKEVGKRCNEDWDLLSAASECGSVGGPCFPKVDLTECKAACDPADGCNGVSYRLATTDDSFGFNVADVAPGFRGWIWPAS